MGLVVIERGRRHSAKSEMAYRENKKGEDKWVKERTLNVAGILGNLEGRRTYKKRLRGAVSEFCTCLLLLGKPYMHLSV